MRSGDNIDNFKGRFWTIAFVGEVSSICPDFRSGRWALLMSVRFTLSGQDEIVTRFEHEDDIRGHWSRGPSFAVGQMVKNYRWRGDHLRIHYIDDMLVTLVDAAGNFLPDWRWRLALHAGHLTHLDFDSAPKNDAYVRADHLGEVDA